MDGGLQFRRGSGVLTGQGGQLAGQLAAGGGLQLDVDILGSQLLALGAVALGEHGVVALGCVEFYGLALQLAALLPDGEAGQQRGGDQDGQHAADEGEQGVGDHAASLSARSYAARSLAS
ncbi:hypothetical protein [Chromobacterium vaccinii]|uniref:hypothetical protein n=1 Tax=Chromobacterium vaccinii TaxID=1108595 RepID=UPI001C930DB3